MGIRFKVGEVSYGFSCKSAAIEHIALARRQIKEHEKQIKQLNLYIKQAEAAVAAAKTHG